MLPPALSESPSSGIYINSAVTSTAYRVVTGWLGGELVYVHKVGVAQGEAHAA